MILHQWISVIAAASIVGTTIWLIRHDKLRATDALWWLGISGLIAVTGLLPQTVSSISNGLGIAYPPSLTISVGFGVLIIKTLIADTERSKTQHQTRSLAQKIALLEDQVGSTTNNSHLID